MRKLVISAAMIGLICGAGLAMAQDHDRDRGDGPQEKGPQPHAAPARPGPARSGPEPREHQEAPAMRAAQPPANTMRTNDNQRRDRNAMQPNNAPGRSQPNNNAVRGPDNGPRPDFNRPGNGPNNATRGQGQRRDFSSVRNFHQNFRAQRRFQAPAYRRPPGWYAHTWAWGQVLPVAFWPRDYWITDFTSYDLPPPPFGAIWVRVGDDALLIDQDSGEIIEVDYGIFY